MAKRIAQRADWLDCPAVDDIYSLSNCISDDFADYITSWKHNGYWLFDSPDAIERLASDLGISLEGTTLFYYEVHEFEYDQERTEWLPFTPEPSFPTDVIVPTDSRLVGYDVVSFFVRSSPECSPLSCNGLAASMPVNRHCLLPAFQETLELVGAGAFANGEPGPLRIFSVHHVPWVRPDQSFKPTSSARLNSSRQGPGDT